MWLQSSYKKNEFHFIVFIRKKNQSWPMGSTFACNIQSLSAQDSFISLFSEEIEGFISSIIGVV